MAWFQKSKVNEFRNHFKTRNKFREYTAHTSKVHSVAWSCDGGKLASGSCDKTVAIFSLDKDRLNKDFIFRGHTGSVDQLCWHTYNPELLSSASGDRTVRIWDARQLKCAVTIYTRGENINITWAPDGNTIAVGSKEDIVSFIDTRTQKIKSEEQYSFEVNEISWNKKGSLFFLTTGEGYIHVLSYPNLKSQAILKAHTANCICIEFDPSGQYFAVGSADALVSLWDADELACIRTIERLDWPVRTLSFSHDSQLLASASEDHFIDISEVKTGAKVMQIPVQASTFTIDWHPKQYLLAYACEDRDQYDNKRDSGTLKVFGFPSD